YGSSLPILSAYASSTLPVLSLPLYMACDDSDGYTNSVIAAMSGVFYRYCICKSEPHLLPSHPNSRLKQRFELFSPEDDEKDQARSMLLK
nr:hypothetical protein [Tanacetum cinerariifolium]